MSKKPCQISCCVLVRTCKRVRIFKTDMSASTVPEVVGKQMSENPSMQVDIPVAFLARGPGSDELIEATSKGQFAELKYEALKHFASLDPDATESSPDSDH
jgi:hypothetical protein